MLTRYWIQFAPGEAPIQLRKGCGVTASSRDEAIALVRDVVFSKQAVPSIESIIEDVDVRSLDQDHVIPNMGFCARKGVWFPMGYEGGSL